MKKFISLALAGTVVMALALPAGAAANKVDRVAKQECRIDRASEPAEFAAEWGGTGKAALKKCARAEKREAARECRTDRATEPREFAIEYGGTGRDAMQRCKIDELR